MVAVALAGAGSAIGAQANSATLAYHCAFPAGAQPVSVAVTAQFPDSAATGTPIQPAGVALAITLPAAEVASLTGSGASTVAVTADLSTRVTQAGAYATADWSDLIAPRTALPASGSLTVGATGTVPPATPAGTGDVTFTAGALSLAFDSATTVSCSLDEGQAGTLGTVAVPAAGLSSTPASSTASGPSESGSAPVIGAGPTQHSGAVVTPNAAIQLTGWVVGCSNVKKLGSAACFGPGRLSLTNTGSALVNGDFHLYWTGTLYIPPAAATFLTFGIAPTTGIMHFTEVGSLWIDSWAHAGVPHATAVDNQTISLLDVNVNQKPLLVGTTCQTTMPVHIVLSGISPYQPVLGGPLEGVVTIPPFTGCGTTENLDSLLTGSISGPGNLIRVIQGKPCNILTVGCTPTVPVFK
jgi:hypothetical protein